MAFTGQRVTVAATPTVVFQMPTVSTRVGSRRYSVKVVNKGTVSVFLGDAVSNGFELAVGEEREFSISGNEVLYGIAASGTNRVDVISNYSLG